ncbi:MAG TPA: YaiO family outer membrane beta-barrel protein [Bacteroidia bacterium]|nr:YaiO family outer membrane beta-barrel protein [Bacteroidia bacterium]
MPGRVSILLFVIFIGIGSMRAQNADSLFEVAKKSAYTKNYAKAQSLCKQLVLQYPQNTDYKIFLGRVFAWAGKNDSAKLVLTKIIETETKNADAYDALTDAELWSNDNTHAIEHCKQALTFTREKEQEKFLLKLAKAYYTVEDYKDAKETIDTLLTKNPVNKDAKKLRDDITKALYKNYISVTYLNVSFSNPASPSWNYASVEYQRKFKNCPLVGRFNYGNAYNQNGYQFEVDAYPKLRKGTYMYLNAGYASDTVVFPIVRAGADLYQKLVYGFEVSGGARFLHFKQENIFIYTIYLGKYYKNWWFAYRPFLVNKSNDAFFSHTAIVRNYFSGSDNYVSLNLIYGATPYTTTTFQDISKVNSQRIGIDAQFKIGQSFLVKPMFSYEYEEYYPGLFRDRFYSQVTLLKRF